MRYKPLIPKQFKNHNQRQRLLLRAVLAEMEFLDECAYWDDDDINERFGNKENYRKWCEAIYGIYTVRLCVYHVIRKPVEFGTIEYEDWEF